MCKLTFVVFFILYENQVSTYSVDQRQTGDLNVQIDLKNLQVIALMKGKEEYVDYDYAYDYSDITIKPQNGTTKKPLNVTETTTFSSKENSTALTATETTIQQSNYSSTTTEKLLSADALNNSDDLTTTTVTSTITPQGDIASTTITSNTVGIVISTAVPSDGCKKGFFRNTSGNCELRLQNPSNTLLKMIKQKSKSSGNGPRRT